MIVTCQKCNRNYDDAECWTLCPHGPLWAAHDAYCPKCDLVNCPCKEQESDADYTVEYDPCQACDPFGITGKCNGHPTETYEHYLARQRAHAWGMIEEGYLRLANLYRKGSCDERHYAEAARPPRNCRESAEREMKRLMGEGE